MTMRLAILITPLLLILNSCTTYKPAPPQELFKNGESDHHTYRIPSLVTTKDGTLLAFAEGRVNGSGDSGDINLVIRRSEDGGHTWSDNKVIWDDGANVCGNPTPVVLDNGDIVLLLTWGHGKELSLIHI